MRARNAGAGFLPQCVAELHCVAPTRCGYFASALPVLSLPALRPSPCLSARTAVWPVEFLGRTWRYSDFPLPRAPPVLRLALTFPFWPAAAWRAWLLERAEPAWLRLVFRVSVAAAWPVSAALRVAPAWPSLPVGSASPLPGVVRV